MAGKFDTTIPERLSSLEARHNGLDERVKGNYKLMREMDFKLDQVLETMHEAKGAAKFAKILYGGLTVATGGLAGWMSHFLNR